MRYSPHDNFVRLIFSIQSVYFDFFDQIVPPALTKLLRLETLKPVEGTFLSPRLRKYLTDKLFSCQMITGEDVILSCLIEHKSSVPDFIYDQLQGYVAQKHEQDRKDKQPRTPVIVIVLYHGKERWVKKPPHEYYTGLPKGLRSYVAAPNFFLVDVGRFSKQRIMKLRRGYLVNSLLVLKYAFRPSWLGRNFRDIFVYGDFYNTTAQGRDFIHGLLVYFLELTNFDEKKSIALVEKIKASYKRTAMNSLQNLVKAGKKEGKIEGRKEGKIEGKIEGKEEVVQHLILKFPDWSDLFLSEVTGLPQEKIKALREKLANGQNGKSGNGTHQ